MPADNQLGGHGGMWSHCFPEGILLWMQHLRIIFDFNAMDMMQIFKSIPMVVNWYKTEIAQYFYKWCFFYIYYQTENMNRKGIMWVKASEGTAMPCGFTRHPQHGMGKSPSKCYNPLQCIQQSHISLALFCSILVISWASRNMLLLGHYSSYLLHLQCGSRNIVQLPVKSKGPG